ncbi:glycosyl transferase family 1 [Paraburkholderia eburnea]|uniref:Glycosyl transferase family 1 n=1 Tax=Paraburkholderia eburnea TaxID=1189126 RepID=A0A2S4LTM7_9BURK|nr:glycosyltransferase family 4 protein [Paraburkholderia eburnea]POR45802.1 glycosyl transferase family 1 [Paraburkholderia eburnea]PRZ14659.1 glycosyl transferase family 1 [Paraburkholderia eburnea]
MLMRNPRPLRVLTWHVHGNYLYYLTQAPHEFHIVTKPGHPPGYAGRVGALPWGANVHEVAAQEVVSREFDLIVYQHRSHWEHDRLDLLSEAQRRLPRVYIEHDPPQEAPFAQRHWVDDPGTLLVHVTPFNALMWDSGKTPARVIEHGVLVPGDARYRGDRVGNRARGIVVVNHLRERGRRLGADVFEAARRDVPLDLVGMDAQSLGGIGEIPNPDLPAFIAPYRFFFNPIRWTSLGLAIVEAMTVGLPIVGLATTELASVVRNGENGFVDTRLDKLVESMRALIHDPALARQLGDAARRTALERFAIDRFAHDWDVALREVAA